MSIHPCASTGCTRPGHTRGLCQKHYRRLLTHGDHSVNLNPRMDHASLAEKLAAYVDRTAGPESCWPWTRGLSSDGYGRVYPPTGRNSVGAHRVAYEMTHGPVPPGLEVLHSCDNPPCCNPAHLSVGTHATNMGQMSQRGRSARGPRNPLCKLSDDQVEHARLLRAEGALVREIAAAFSISPSYVSRLVRGERR